MRTFIVLLVGAAALAAKAQSTNAPAALPTELLLTPPPAAVESQSTNASVAPPGERFHARAAFQSGATAPALRELKPNEIAVGNRIVSGIVIAAAKAANPLQLLNPAAPPEYGSAEDNLVINSITKKSDGLKFLAIKF
jgi:hypothetical protein